MRTITWPATVAAGGGLWPMHSAPDDILDDSEAPPPRLRAHRLRVAPHAAWSRGRALRGEKGRSPGTSADELLAAIYTTKGRIICVPIRFACSSDVESVLELWREAAYGASVTDDRAGVSLLLSHNPSALLVADQGGLIVGTSSGRRREIRVHQLDVTRLSRVRVCRVRARSGRVDKARGPAD